MILLPTFTSTNLRKEFTLVKDPVWAHGVARYRWDRKTAMLNGTAVGTVALSYDNNSKFWKPDWCSEVMGCNPAKWDVSPDDGWQAYYVIEAAIPLAMIGISTSSNRFYHYALSWTQNCGNDAIRLTGRDPGRSVPEPGALCSHDDRPGRVGSLTQKKAGCARLIRSIRISYY